MIVPNLNDDLPPTECAENLLHGYGAEEMDHPPTRALGMASVLPNVCVGSTLHGFRLVEQIGQGAFARVFLAQQGDLADRPVVLKLMQDAVVESGALARLQHTHIVPIHSVHHHDDCQIVCMPYFGRYTLADLYRSLAELGDIPSTKQQWIESLTQTSFENPIVAAPRQAASDVSANVQLSKLLAHIPEQSYVRTVLTIVGQIASGLAHAHDRGIIHRDIKPANILITDEGSPMILDFNLAYSNRFTASELKNGGTIPYMSPEQLQAMADGGQTVVDAQTDIYALGVILHELLVRRTPFGKNVPLEGNPLEAMLTPRRHFRANLRASNKAVTPAIESIAQRCLEYNPKHRYQSAQQLQDDIECQLTDRPLRHAPERSLQERIGKWRRRNRIISSTLSLSLGAMLFAVLVVTGLVYRDHRRAELVAAAVQQQTHHDVQSVQLLVMDRNSSPEEIDEGIELSRQILERFGGSDPELWSRSPNLIHLESASRAVLQRDLATVSYLLAQAHLRRGNLQTARTINRQSMKLSMLQAQVPRAFWQQQGRIAERQGLKQEAENAFRKAEISSAASDWDQLLMANEHILQGEFRQATTILESLTQVQPTELVAWFLLSDCYQNLQRHAEAVGALNSCIALRPDFQWAWYNRGLAHRRQQQWERAKADFDTVIGLNPDSAFAYLNRAIVWESLDKDQNALEDYHRALQANGPRARILFRRAKVYRRLGQHDAAQQELKVALAAVPETADGFVDRGLVLSQHRPESALDDFNAALRLDPTSYRALENKAALLSDKFRDDDAALSVLNQVVAYYPDFVIPRAGRAVLLARIGKGSAAIDDAQYALRLDASGPVIYRAACVYALLSKKHPEYRYKAIELLSAALKSGFGHKLIDHDSDLDALQEMPEFQALVAASQTIA